MVLATMSAFLVVGCQKNKPADSGAAGSNAPSEMNTGAAPDAPPEPDPVAAVPNPSAKWKAVNIAFVNKKSGKESIFALDIAGASVDVAEYKLKIKCLEFLPDFVMDGAQKISRSYDLQNPAIKVLIEKEGESAPLESWLFAKYPTMHAPEIEGADIMAKSLITVEGKEEQMPAADVIPADATGGDDSMPKDGNHGSAGKKPAGEMPAGH